MEKIFAKPNESSTSKNSNRLTTALDLLIDFLLEEYGQEIQPTINKQAKPQTTNNLVKKIH